MSKMLPSNILIEINTATVVATAFKWINPQWNKLRLLLSPEFFLLQIHLTFFESFFIKHFLSDIQGYQATSK